MFRRQAFGSVTQDEKESGVKIKKIGERLSCGFVWKTQLCFGHCLFRNSLRILFGAMLNAR